MGWHTAVGRTRREPHNVAPMGVNSISPGSPHVRPMGVHRTCGARPPGEIKKKTHPKNMTALYREQAVQSGSVECRELLEAAGAMAGQVHEVHTSGKKRRSVHQSSWTLGRGHGWFP